jgi:hypothetical protein
VEEEFRRLPAKGSAEMIRKVFYEVDPPVCRQCQSHKRILSILIDYAVADRISAA